MAQPANSDATSRDTTGPQLTPNRVPRAPKTVQPRDFWRPTDHVRPFIRFKAALTRQCEVHRPAAWDLAGRAGMR